MYRATTVRVQETSYTQLTLSPVYGGTTDPKGAALTMVVTRVQLGSSLVMLRLLL